MFTSKLPIGATTEWASGMQKVTNKGLAGENYEYCMLCTTENVINDQVCSARLVSPSIGIQFSLLTTRTGLTRSHPTQLDRHDIERLQHCLSYVCK